MEAQENNLFNKISSENSKQGRLYIITTPIGEYYDITFRAIKKLSEVDFIICEDFKIANRLLKFLGIDKKLFLLNEHNEKDDFNFFTEEIISGKTAGLISDCGTPSFADPGINLVRECIYFNLPIEFINGSNSVLSALVVSGFDISRFYFYGFLSPKKEMRKNEIKNISYLDYPAILMDTPYRLLTLLNDLSEIIPDRKISLSMNLSTSGEKTLRGTANYVEQELQKKFGNDKIKAEFVLIIDKVHKK